MVVIAIIAMALPCKRMMACDQCGCAAGGMYSNIMPFATGNFIGLRSGFYSFSSKSPSELLSAHFFSLDLIGNYSVNRNLNLTGYLPYRINDYTGSDVNFHASGPGDAGVFGNYIVASNRDSIMKKSLYTISLKGGAEFPTGKFNDAFRGDRVPASISTGSGSFDFMSGCRFIYKIKKTTVAADYTYRFNCINAHHYNFGDQQSLALMVSEKLIKSGWAFTPYAGATGEFSTDDYYYTLKMDGTRGGSVFANAGCEFNRRQIIFGMAADVPLYTDFGGISKAAPRYNARIIYMFD